MSTDRLRILFLTPQLAYPPHQGTTIRNYNLIKGLSPRYDIDLLSFAAMPTDPEAMDHLRSLCHEVETVPEPTRSTRERLRSTFTQPLPDMGLRLESRQLHERLAAWLDERVYDVIQVEGIEMAPYLFQAASRPAPRPLLVYDDHNAEYVLQRRAFQTDLAKPSRWPAAAYSFVQWQKLARYERQACQTADRVIAVSSADAKAIHRLCADLPVQVVPNGVDLEYWSPERRYPALPQTPSLVFVGKMDFRPNVDAALWFWRRVLPLIRQAVPSIHFYLVGKSPHPRLAPLAADPGVTVTGYVDDVRPYVGGADVYVVPLRIGGGTRLKVLEAMAMGKGIVSTTLGCEGIGLMDGQEALLADSPRDFAQRVLALLEDAELRAILGRQANEFATIRYDWHHIVPMLDPIYADGA